MAAPLTAMKRTLLVPPPYTRGSATVNRLGLQPARMLYEAARRAVLPGPRDADAALAAVCDDLDRDGVATIPNFLAPEDFAAVAAAADEWHRSPLVKTLLGSDGPVHRDHHQVDWTRDQVAHDDADVPDFLAPILQVFGDDDRLPVLVASVMGSVRGGLRPDVVYEHLTLPEDATDDTDNLLIMHADRHFPTVKMFLALAPNGEDEGAFEYCLGSHRMSADRLAVEREYAVWCAHQRAGDDHEIPDAAWQNGRIGLTPEQWDRLGLDPTPIVAEPNTLIVANNRGFHRRGRMTPGHTRVQLRLIYHQLREPVTAPLVRAAARLRDR